MRYSIVGSAECRQFIAPTLAEALTDLVTYLTSPGEFIGHHIVTTTGIDDEAGLWYVTIYYNHGFTYDDGRGEAIVQRGAG